MKPISKTLILMLLAITPAIAVKATTRVVNNTMVPVAAGQYMTLTSAISASANGDTLLVTGSLVRYETGVGNITVDRRLVIIGNGFSPKGANTNASVIDPSVYLTPAASGSVLIGLTFNRDLQAIAGSGTAHKNITFSRNLFYDVCYFNVDSSINIKFINNVHKSNVDGVIQFNAADMAYNCGVYNSIFYINGDGILTRFDNPACPNIEIDHNLFISGNNAHPLRTNGAYIDGTYLEYISGCWTRNATITNNIFYNVNPIEWSNYNYYANNYLIGNLLYNNITYSGSTMATLPNTNEYGSGNLDNTDPKMVGLFTNSANPLDLNLDNFNLQSSSPCLNAGTDGTNIGPTGGRYPIYNTNARYITGEPALPQTTQISGPVTVPVGTPLNLTVKAKKQN